MNRHLRARQLLPDSSSPTIARATIARQHLRAIQNARQTIARQTIARQAIALHLWDDVSLIIVRTWILQNILFEYYVTVIHILR